jgi:hypothetical protein
VSRGSSLPMLEFRFRFRTFVIAFFHFIRDGLCYMLAQNQEERKGASAGALWILNGHLGWLEERDEFVTNRQAALDPQSTRSLYDLGMQASVDFAYWLFADEDIVRSRYSFVKKSPFAELVPKVQELLLFFKRNCEDTLLKEECYRYQGQIQKTSRLRLEHFMKEDELLDPAAVDAASELQKCNKALDTGSAKNTYLDGNMVKVGPFSRKTAGLNAILERCDDVERKRYWARLAASEGKAEMAR